MRKLALAVTVLALACSSDNATGPSGLNGTWQFSGNATNSAISASCTASATVNITQSGSTFSGTVSSGTETCTALGAQTTVSLTGGAITGGQINGSSVTFSDNGGCSYTGTTSGSPINKISGNESCTVPVGGSNYTLTGSWQVTR